MSTYDLKKPKLHVLLRDSNLGHIFHVYTKYFAPDSNLISNIICGNNIRP